jgi:hypothetical protein
MVDYLLFKFIYTLFQATFCIFITLFQATFYAIFALFQATLRCKGTTFFSFLQGIAQKNRHSCPRTQMAKKE